MKRFLSAFLVAGSIALACGCTSSPGDDGERSSGDALSASKPTVNPSLAGTNDALRFTAGTVLTNFGAGTNHFPADFTATPGFYMNRSGQDLVIKALHITLESARYALGAAAVDICLNIIPPVHGDHGTRTGVEQLCIAQQKSDATAEWPAPAIHLDLPGQGLLLRPGEHTVCTAQGAVVGPVGTRSKLADFSCTLDLARADREGSLPPVQSIRAPYFDERFRAEVSSFTPHVNPTQAGRRILGMMSYIAVASTQVALCVDTKPAAGAWSFQCADVDRSKPDVSGAGIVPLDFPFGPDDQISSHCQIANPAGSFANICAAYFFVSVPRNLDGFAPLAINDTIPAGGARSFCHHAHADAYGFTEPAIEENRDRCTLVLGGTP